jgi:PAS domain S-box-containing protein
MPSDVSPCRAGTAHEPVVGLANHTLLIRKDGSEPFIDDSGAPIRGADGRITGVVLVFGDVSARRQAEEEQQRLVRELAEQRGLLPIVLDNARPMLASVDRELRFLEVNAQYAQAVGLAPGEIVGKPYAEVWPDPMPLTALKQVQDTGEIRELREYRVTNPRHPGQVRYTDWSMTPIRDEQGQVRLIVISAADVTDYVLVRERIAADRRLLDTIVENTETQLAYLDPGFRFVWVNGAYERGCGHSREELIGRDHFELFPSAENEAIFRRVRDTGQPAVFREKPSEYADQPERGTTYWDWTLRPVKNERGEVEGLAFSLTDTTEQVRQRERLLAAEHSRTELLETLNREISHRTKNNLAMAASLLQMQIMSGADPHVAEVLQDTVSRLFVFADVHDQMSFTGMGEVDLTTAARRCAASMAGAFAKDSVEAAVEGAPVLLPGKVATNLCIAANELMTNAVKYGAPEEDGKVRVRVRIDQEEGRLRLGIWNSGNPVPPDLDLSRQHSMGLSLVQSLTAGQYRGGLHAPSPQRGHSRGDRASGGVPPGGGGGRRQPYALQEWHGVAVRYGRFRGTWGTGSDPHAALSAHRARLATGGGMVVGAGSGGVFDGLRAMPAAWRP